MPVLKKKTQTEYNYTWTEFEKDSDELIRQILTGPRQNWKVVYGIPKGGLPLAVKIANRLNVPLVTRFEDIPKAVDKYDVLIVDDISDSGNTLSKIPEVSQYNVVTLHYKIKTKVEPNYLIRHFEEEDWIVYPWE